MSVNAVKQVLTWAAYPAAMALSITIYLSLLGRGESVIASTYIPILLAAALVLVLEQVNPHLAEWKPKKADVWNDLWFMALVQVVLPRLLMLFLTTVVLAGLYATEPPVASWWPHQWPLVGQVLLMVLLVDFMRYWLHRAAHTYMPLWRLHAVHHSPEKLYFVNVGRFHPLEKVLQFLLDSVPFVLIGVDQRVIAFYFVLYATNGFFQHSNIRLRYGVLNYLVGSAETHRWHHSRDHRESNNNYGNNIIIWDLLFGTWFLPKDRQIRELGLVNRRYPKGFLDQMKTPFIRGITDRDVTTVGFVDLFARALTAVVMRLCDWLYWRPLRRAAACPKAAQWRLLRRILRQNRHSRFGSEHGFERIETVEMFREAVPIQTYEMLRPYVEQQARTQSPALTQESPLMYAVTSGTTGAPKYIPVPPSTLHAYRVQQRMLSSYQHSICPEAFHGMALGIVSPAEEGRLDSGAPFGSVSGYMYRSMPWVIRRRYIVPAAVFDISDYLLKYRVILRLALAQRDITYLGSANPSSFLRLLAVLNEHRDELIDSVRCGRFEAINPLPPAIRQAIEPALRADPERADELRTLIQQHGELTYANVWPTIRMLSIWTGGSCGIALETLKQKLPPKTVVTELGYVSSEFRGTLTIDRKTNAGMPTLQHHFFEFVERDDWDNGAKKLLTLEQLQADREYYVIITSDAGLYRYFMNDVVRVVGFYEKTPLIRFMQKGKGVTSITGEKMYESQVLEAIQRAQNQFGFSSIFFLALADEHARHYALYLEADGFSSEKTSALAEFVDRALGELNIEYHGKRGSERLLPLRVLLLQPGTGEAYKQHCVARGQREGQFKHVALQNKKDAAFPFDQYLLK